MLHKRTLFIKLMFERISVCFLVIFLLLFLKSANVISAQDFHPSDNLLQHNSVSQPCPWHNRSHELIKKALDPWMALVRMSYAYGRPQ